MSAVPVTILCDLPPSAGQQAPRIVVYTDEYNSVSVELESKSFTLEVKDGAVHNRQVRWMRPADARALGQALIDGANLCEANMASL